MTGFTSVVKQVARHAGQLRHEAGCLFPDITRPGECQPTGLQTCGWDGSIVRARRNKQSHGARGYGKGADPAGRSIRTVVPLCTSVSTNIPPWQERTMLFTRAIPKPRPTNLVEKKGSNILATVS